MDGSKLLVLLRTFSKREWKAFGKYLRSPYLNTNKRLILFYDLLNKFHPSFAHSQLSKPIFFQKLYPEKEMFDDRLLRALMAELHKSGEQFICIEQFRSDKKTRSKMLVRYYGERGLYGRFESGIKYLLEEIDQQKIKDIDAYYDEFELNIKHHFHPNTNALTTDVDSLKRGADKLDEFYALAKLRISCEMKARERVVNETSEYPLLDPVCAYVRNILGEKNSVSLMYLNLLELNSEIDNVEIFHHLKTSFKKNASLLSKREQLEFLTYLINAAYRYSRTYGREYSYILFELFKEGIKGDVFLEKGIIPDLRFTNIVVIAASLYEWKWVKTFVETFKIKLDPAIKEDAINLSKAFIFLHQKDFQSAYGYSNLIRSKRTSYSIRKYDIELRCLFEMTCSRRDYLDVYVSRINAYQKLLERQKTFERKRIEANLNYVKMMKKAANILAIGEPCQQQWKLLYAEAEKIHPLIAKKWLTNRFKELSEKGN